MTQVFLVKILLPSPQGDKHAHAGQIIMIINQPLIIQTCFVDTSTDKLSVIIKYVYCAKAGMTYVISITSALVHETNTAHMMRLPYLQCSFIMSRIVKQVQHTL